MKDIVIFDLDGTLALIDKRRTISTKPNGKMDWGIFFDPKNINLDEPNIPVITMARMLHSQGFNIVIFSGRTNKTEHTTRSWLTHNRVPFHKLVMRDKVRHFMPDNEFKKQLLDEYVDIDDVFLVVDDRQQVVDMWRKNGLITFQVANGNF